MRSKCSWFLTAGVLLAALGCSDPYAKPLPPPRDEATRRAAQRERTAEDFKQIAKYYKAYCSETKEPTSAGFWTYINGQDEARTIRAFIKEEQYAVQVPPGGTGMIGFERGRDLDNTRVVVMADGSVNKAMPEADFKAVCPDHLLNPAARP